MVFASYFIFLFSITHANNQCMIQSKSPTGAFENLSHSISLTASTSVECVEQEIVDIVLNPYRAQSLAVNMCEKEKTCLDFLKKEAVRVSKKPEFDFSNMKGAQLWSEILKYSSVNRIRPPELSDLPLKDNPEELFEKIKAQKMSERNLNSNQAVAISCAVLAAIIGPGKFKALGAATQAVKLTPKIQISHAVENIFKHNGIPPHVKKKFHDWEADVREKGLLEVRKIPGVHDEPLHGKLKGKRSIRLNDGYRVCYESTLENSTEVIKVFMITKNHTDYCH